MSEKATADENLTIGLDIGSTTVKVVVVDCDTRRIVWSDYQRHLTRQAEKTHEMLLEAERRCPALSIPNRRVFLTGSGSKPLVDPLNGEFVQEVNAVTLAVESLHPDVGSVIELGGQDAKIIVFKTDPNTGQKVPRCSMNDKCASGTGATIDKCLIKVGLEQSVASKVRFNPDKLHKVAAKCGVFAETDIVNLVKSSIDPEEILCSLADGIVHQNLSVLARGQTLGSTVLLLGGPNTYLQVMKDCWRYRIPETWQERGYPLPTTGDVEDWIQVPENAQYYAAYGAVIYGLEEPDKNRYYSGSEQLSNYLREKSSSTKRDGSGPPLVESKAEQELFIEEYSIPKFDSFKVESGATVRAAIGLDGGSTSSKAVLLSEDGDVLFKAYQLSKGNPLQDLKELLENLKHQVTSQNAELEIIGFGATGYAADVVKDAVGSDATIVETVAHQMSATHFFDAVDVICDVGGQDIKVLFLRENEIRDFRLSNQCSAGNGMLLQAMADQFGIPVTDYASVAFDATQSPDFTYGCAVFLDSDRVNFQKEGYTKQELLAGLARVLPKNIWQYVVQVPRLAEFGTRYVLQGGTQNNLAAVKAQVDYILKRVPDAEIHVHPHSGEAGAIGAALEALRVVTRVGKSRFVGLDAAIKLTYTTTNDETTRCYFCPNECSRTFVDTSTLDGQTARYISGFSCERGTVESKETMKQLVLHRKQLKKDHVNLLEYEAKTAFRKFYKPKNLPEADTTITRFVPKRNLLGFKRSRKTTTRFERAGHAEQEFRRVVRIGMPRALNLFSMAPFFRTYFEALGIPSGNLSFSPATSEELFQEGAKYGAVDPCYPAKVAQSHIHHLLNKTNRDKRLDYIYFPTITHVPTFVEHSMDSTCCPVAAGTPNVQRAAFTGETDFFAANQLEYVDDATNFMDRAYLKHQLWTTWHERLKLTRDESDFAVDEGWQALTQFQNDLEERGLEILEQMENENRVAILVLGRPYHADPGINHDILEQFQACGYPVLTVRSLPKDAAWLARWFDADIKSGRIRSPLDIRDVWPENYSANSVQKVWAAKFAARHPNIAVLDLSSFKCGHDAPTYGLIDSIIKAGKKPYMALHDLDANKPSGSIKIRVSTYTYTLQRYEERLRDQAAQVSELERRVADKRRELIAERRETLKHLRQTDPAVSVPYHEMEAAFQRYLQDEVNIFGVTESSLQQKYACEGPLHQSQADVAPLSPTLDQPIEAVANPSFGQPLIEIVKSCGSGGCSTGGCSSGGCNSGPSVVSLSLGSSHKVNQEDDKSHTRKSVPLPIVMER